MTNIKSVFKQIERKKEELSKDTVPLKVGEQE